jgi:hypothetical protein
VHTSSDSRTASAFVSEDSKRVKTATLSFKLTESIWSECTREGPRAARQLAREGSTGVCRRCLSLCSLTDHGSSQCDEAAGQAHEGRSPRAAPEHPRAGRHRGSRVDALAGGHSSQGQVALVPHSGLDSSDQGGHWSRGPGEQSLSHISWCSSECRCRWKPVSRWGPAMPELQIGGPSVAITVAQLFYFLSHHGCCSADWDFWVR